ncbi:MAG: hypothetical protein H6906_13340 [Hyphomicrobiales bacterium]|nr:hypothetical protein [Hyphomicrobiales bacterium]
MDGPQPIDWRSARTWQKLGYGLTAAWMLFVILYTDSDPGHPLFNAIFLVPIAGWVAAIALARVLGPRLRRDPPPEAPSDPPER